LNNVLPSICRMKFYKKGEDKFNLGFGSVNNGPGAVGKKQPLFSFYYIINCDIIDLLRCLHR